jgi:cytochrome c oxidase cbb3-type subunit 4
MYKEVLSGIENISIYPVLSFSVFFIFFTVMSIWVIKSRKEDFEEVSRAPLN